MTCGIMKIRRWRKGNRKAVEEGKRRNGDGAREMEKGRWSKGDGVSEMEEG